jgi:hypothetical protein
MRVAIAMRLYALMTVADQMSAAIWFSSNTPAASAYTASGTWPSWTSVTASVNASAAR